VSINVTPRSMAAWIVAMPSSSELAPYIPLMPMQPSAMGNTSGPVAPSFVFVALDPSLIVITS